MSLWVFFFDSSAPLVEERKKKCLKIETLQPSLLLPLAVALRKYKILAQDKKYCSVSERELKGHFVHFKGRKEKEGGKLCVYSFLPNHTHAHIHTHKHTQSYIASWHWHTHTHTHIQTHNGKHYTHNKTSLICSWHCKQETWFISFSERGKCKRQTREGKCWMNVSVHSTEPAREVFRIASENNQI